MRIERVQLTKILAVLFVVASIVGDAFAIRPPVLRAMEQQGSQRANRSLWGIPDPPAAPGNAHRVILWSSYEELIDISDERLELWKSRGVDGFVVQTRYLDEMGGIENWTGDPNDPLSSTPVEGQDVHIRQRTLRDKKFVERCHARGLSVYLGMYLSNYHNLSTPLKVWNDDQGWSQIVIPMVRGFAGAAKLLGVDGIATDSEMYRSEDQTWNWNYPGVAQSEATVRALARQRGKEFMTAVLAGFPNVEIINYRIEIPGDWEEKVQQQVNHVIGIWDKSVFLDFWNGIVDTGGFSSIHFFDPIFYKSWHVGTGWDAALEYNINGVRTTLSKRWDNWSYASPRFFLSPFAWIDPGPSAGSFDDARPVDYVAKQLEAFHKWGEGNMFGLYAQHVNDFDYTPYVPALQAASTPDRVQPALRDGVQATGSPSEESNAARSAPTWVLHIPSNSAPLALEHVAKGVVEPTDAAFSPDGRLFITERAGAIRILHTNGALSVNIAPALHDLWTKDGNGLLAVAVDPQFDRTHFVYVIYTAVHGSEEPAFRLVRFRELGDTLGEGAVLVDGVPAARADAAVSLRFGPDQKLYVSFDAGGSAGRIGNMGSYSGKILRLNADGTTPADQPMTATPIYGYGFKVPLGLDWQPATGILWAAGRDVQDAGRLRPVVENDTRSALTVDRTPYGSSLVTGASAMAFYRGSLIPWLDGELLVAGSTGPAVTRVRFDRYDPTRLAAIAPLVDNVGSPVRALAVSPEGAIYFCVNDEIVRLVNTIRKN